MTFGTLDIERDFSKQGYRDVEYDMVFAVSVLHITANLKQTLLNIRRAMKIGGKLIMQESFKADGWTLGFVFGVFPGWWLGSQDRRALSPSITLGEWDSILKETGFSDTDLVLRDFRQDVAHHYGWVVSTAVGSAPLDQPQSAIQSRWTMNTTIVVDNNSPQQRLLANRLVPHLRGQWAMQSVIVDFNDFAVEHDSEASGFLIFLADYGTPFLPALTKDTWGWFQHLMQRYHHCLWVSGGGGRRANPHYGMVDGLARTLRLEYPGFHLVTLALDATCDDPDDNISSLVLFLSAMMSRTSSTSYEEEYVELGGLLHTRRLVDANYVKLSMDAKLAPYEVSALPLRSQIPFEMTVGSWDEKDTAHYIASSPFSDIPKGDGVDVALKAVALHRQVRSRVQQSAGDLIWQSACAELYSRQVPRRTSVLEIVSSSLPEARSARRSAYRLKRWARSLPMSRFRMLVNIYRQGLLPFTP